MPRNIDKYRHHFKNYDLTEAQERDIIEALFAIAETFADLAFGVHPSQHLHAANDNDSMSEFNVVKFFHQSANDPILEEHALLAELEDKPKTATKRS